ncbi:carbohydrate esterase family 8 protein [Hebeloma cylindrosporum]|uniref:Pectinesterase n=1 Tax=Hebeloma cylindrosporum TaxID=76867 RepID=A0A0C2YJE1_HEBCY|nr:carbohydrate esterase family 8 protein [Hebeloma cylindrosporum h7]
MAGFSSSLAYLFFISLFGLVIAASRTVPPPDAIVVRLGTTTYGEFNTVSDAVNSLPQDNSASSIFIYPGEYNEQVYINRTGPLTIYGYTNDTTTYTSNQVTIQACISAPMAGSNDASGTLRVHKNDFKLYNVNVKNTFGVGAQAIAVSQYGSRVGFYACGFYGHQDTVYAQQGTQVYLEGYIEGATDFIFGQFGQAYFGGNTLAVNGPGWVTASGRQSDDNGSFVFNENTIVLAPSALDRTAGNVYLGRPWRGTVIFKNTVVTVPLNPAVWSIWHTGQENTDHVFMVDYNTTGSGINGTSPATFATALNEIQAASYSISSAVGSDYASWVDPSYFV